MCPRIFCARCLRISIVHTSSRTQRWPAFSEFFLLEALPNTDDEFSDLAFKQFGLQILGDCVLVEQIRLGIRDWLLLERSSRSAPINASQSTAG